jgi:Ribose/xylose/arabinose/galactoside ABC-type transport systems, permease components
MTKSQVKEQKSRVQAVQQKILDSVLILFAISMIIYFTAASPYFLSLKNFMNILSSVSVVGIIATAMTLVMITRGIDLSVGSTIALTGCVSAILIVNLSMHWLLAIMVTLLIGAIVGIFNGVLITKFKVVPFIATLGSMNMFRGLAFILTNGQAIYVPDKMITFIGTGKVFGLIPIPAIIMMLFFVIFWAITKFTVFGRNVFAVGGNSVASRLAGIPVLKLTLTLYVLTGVLSAIAGLVMTGLTSTAMPSAGDGYNLDTITAVYLGGNSANGGEGSVWRTFMGILIIGILNNGMALLSIQSYWQTFVKGSLLIAAVVFDMLRRK